MANLSKKSKKKNLFINSKKGVALIATTFLLFMLGLFIGIIIARFSSHVSLPEFACEDISNINLAVMDTKPRICQEQLNDTHSKLNFVLENQVEQAISGFHMTFTGDQIKDSYILRDYSVDIPPYQSESKEYAFPDSIGDLQNFRLMIYREIDGHLILCKKAIFQISRIPDCNGLQNSII